MMEQYKDCNVAVVFGSTKNTQVNYGNKKCKSKIKNDIERSHNTIDIQK